MPSDLDQLKKALAAYGHKIDADAETIEVKSTQCIDSKVPDAPGVYWIHTTMPKEAMQIAISDVIGRQRRLRAKPPKGTTLITQKSSGLYCVYSGTEDDMRKRLKQHLFNQGHEGTIKLGCVVDEAPFSEYTWEIRFHPIDSYEFRYAVEAWWRLNKGWPAFCLR